MDQQNQKIRVIKLNRNTLELKLNCIKQNKFK